MDDASKVHTGNESHFSVIQHFVQFAGGPGSHSPAPPTEALSADVNATHDKILLQCAAAIVDITSMQHQVLTLWRERISMMLTPASDDIEENDFEGAVFAHHLRKVVNDGSCIHSRSSSNAVQVDVARPFVVQRNHDDTDSTGLRRSSSSPIDSVPISGNVK